MRVTKAFMHNVIMQEELKNKSMVSQKWLKDNRELLIGE